MINFFDDNYSDNFESYYFDEKNNNYHFFEEDNEINHQIPNESIKEERAIFDKESGFFNYFEKPSSFFDNIFDINLGNTETTSKGEQNELLNQKRKREEIKTKSDKEIILLKEEKNEENMEENEIALEEEEEDEVKSNKQRNKKQNNNNKGRRKKDEKYDDEAAHDKFKPDNVIRKIKTFIFKYILEKLNNSLIDTFLKFRPIDTHIIKYLKKDFNEKLLGRSICDIYMNSDLNKKQQQKIGSNKILIEKILKENKERNTIKILKLTFNDILNIIRNKDKDYFLGQIREKEEKNKNPRVDEYMPVVEDYLLNYENWFYNKKARNVKKINQKKL